ncbi:hypothetical protein AB0223_26025, partial [Klebsiella pneumoniae]
GLTLRRVERQSIKRAARFDLGDWLHDLKWHPTALPASPLLPAHRLLFADDTGVSAALANLLKAEGVSCLLVEPGERFERISETRFRLDPSHLED